jgi:TonB-linked SusC/RagA family outer membrane protein
MQMRRLLMLLLGVFVFCAQLLAQNRTVTGTVTDDKGSPLANASVTVKGTNLGTVTDDKGNFSLNVPENARTLVISSVGYASSEASVAGRSNVSFTLRADDQNMSEVVVVAYGTAKKSEITSSTAQVNYDKFKNRPVTNISSVLEGAAPGIQTLSANGQPGSSQSIRIRGFGSINASNDPLYVVDGVPYSGGLSNFNMDDVESVSALKDAAATALYGSRAANGVIIITTKKGRKGRSGMSVKATNGFVTRALPEYDRVNAFEYYPLMWQAMRNSLHYTTGQTLPTANTNATNGIKTSLGYNPFNVANNAIVNTEGVLNPAAQLLYADDLDWYEGIERQGTRQEYTLNFNGGVDKADYFASFGYVDEKGFVIRSDQKKFMGRLNVNAQPLSWFRTGINLSGTMTNSNQASDGSSTGYVNPFFFARNMGPIYPVYAHNPTTGEYLLNAQGQRFYDYGNMSALGIPNRPAGASAGRHITAETELNQSLYKRNIVSGRTFGEIGFTKDLKFTTNLAVDLTNYYGSSYDNNQVGDGAPGGRASKTDQTLRTYTFNQLVNYAKKIQNHNFSILAGHENYNLTVNDFYSMRQNQIVAGNYDLDNVTTTNNVESSTDLHSIESWLSRVNYDFDGKYILSGSFRRDGNSRFKSDFRWENFWSVGAAWRLDRENFMSVLPFVNALKLRASYGRVGNDAGIGYYPYQALYSLGFNNALEPGIRQSALPNDSITWEGQKSADVALEFGVLKNRISGTVEYYNRTSDDLIFGVQLPLSLGGYTLNKNIGSMVNKGWEVQLSGEVLRQKNFNWRMDLNWATVENEITKMPEFQPEIISGTKKLAVGHSIYDYWLRDWEGVDPTDGSGLYRADKYVASNSRIRGKEDTVTVDQNNAKFIYAGSAIPDFWGSFSNTFSYKGLELSFLLTYSVGGKIYDATYAALMHTGTYGTALHVDALRAWKKAGDITDVPRMDNSKGGVFNAQSTRFLEDASFLNVRSLSLAYNLPLSLVSRIQASNARFFVNGENLQWFSARKGMNVQQNFTGVTSNAYVPAKVITVGVNVNF